MDKTKVTINKDTNEFILERKFKASRQMVWDAYTKAELLEKWWGPRIFKTTIRELDVRPGGVWYYCMTGTEGEWKDVNACGKAFYKEVKEPELLVYVDKFVDDDGNEMPDMPEALVTMTFTEENGETFMKSVTKYEKLEDLEKVVEMGMEAGIKETLDRLGELVEK